MSLWIWTATPRAALTAHYKFLKQDVHRRINQRLSVLKYKVI